MSSDLKKECLFEVPALPHYHSEVMVVFLPEPWFSLKLQPESQRSWKQTQPCVLASEGLFQSELLRATPSPTPHPTSVLSQTHGMNAQDLLMLPPVQSGESTWFKPFLLNIHSCKNSRQTPDLPKLSTRHLPFSTAPPRCSWDGSYTHSGWVLLI